MGREIEGRRELVSCRHDKDRLEEGERRRVDETNTSRI